MLADSMPAAHFALTETSAHPVTKSSFEGETTRSHAHPKEPLSGAGRGNMSVNGMVDADCGAVVSTRAPRYVKPKRRLFGGRCAILRWARSHVKE
jgi:hypothetical protein